MGLREYWNVSKVKYKKKKTEIWMHGELLCGKQVWNGNNSQIKLWIFKKRLS